MNHLRMVGIFPVRLPSKYNIIILFPAKCICHPSSPDLLARVRHQCVGPVRVGLDASFLLLAQSQDLLDLVADAGMGLVVLRLAVSAILVLVDVAFTAALRESISKPSFAAGQMTISKGKGWNGGGVTTGGGKPPTPVWKLGWCCSRIAGSGMKSSSCGAWPFVECGGLPTLPRPPRCVARACQCRFVRAHGFRAAGRDIRPSTLCRRPIRLRGLRARWRRRCSCGTVSAGSAGIEGWVWPWGGM